MILQQIGVVRSPYPTKFAVPRQHGLARVRCFIELDPGVVEPTALRGIEEATHLWVIFGFHHVQGREASTVRPPRLGGNRRLGVLATRSPFRPNPLGLSAVRLVAVDGLRLEVESGDFVDGSPVYDLKPYLPWADAIADARVSWAAEAPTRLKVSFSADAERTLREHPRAQPLRALLEETLAWDPRPAYHTAEPDRRYGVAIADVDVQFSVTADEVRVERIVR